MGTYLGEVVAHKNNENWPSGVKKGIKKSTFPFTLLRLRLTLFTSGEGSEINTDLL